MGTTGIIDLLILASLPSTLCSAIVGLLVWHIKKRIDANKAHQDQHDAARMQYERHLVAMVNANAALAEAVAIAQQNGKCNGETHAALEHMNKTKREQRDFLTRQGLENICNYEN